MEVFHLFEAFRELMLNRGRRGNTDPLNFLGSSRVIFGYMVNLSIGLLHQFYIHINQLFSCSFVHNFIIPHFVNVYIFRGNTAHWVTPTVLSRQRNLQVTELLSYFSYLKFRGILVGILQKMKWEQCYYIYGTT